MTRRLLPLSLCLGALLAGACERPARVANAAAMARNLSQCDMLELVAPAGEVGARAEHSLLRWCGVLGIPLGRVDPHRSGANNPRVVVGTFNDPVVARLLAPTGVELGGGAGVRWVDREFSGDGVALVATYEDPERPGLPLTLVCGSTLAALDPLTLDLRPVARPGARVFRGGRLTLSLRLGAQGAPNEESIVDYEERWDEFEGELVPLESGHPELSLARVGSLSDERASAWASGALETLARLEAWAGPVQKRVHVSMTDELMDIQTLHGVCAFGVPEHGRGAVLVAANPALPEDGRRALAEARLVQTLGFPVTEVDWMLGAAAADAVDSWWGRPLEEWWSYLATQGLLPSPDLIITPGALVQRSTHIRVPARAAFFRYLRETLGAEELARVWRGEEAYAPDEPVLLDFQAWLLERTDPGMEAVRAARAARLDEVKRRARRDGVAIDSPLDTQRSYVVPALAETLDRAGDVGVEALSVQCYWLEDGPQARFAAGAGPTLSGFVEPDAELAHIFGLARARGMQTCMVPVQLVSSSAGRSAWRRRTDVPAWRDYFVDQRRMLEHAGLTAELMGVELLSLGAELRTATKTRVTENDDLPIEIFETKREEWSRSISAARAVFSGGLTYGALWKQELEQVEFWDELDFIGLVYFPRLGTPLGERPSDRSIQGSMTKVLRALVEKGAAHDRPVLLMEVGFPSSSRAWWDAALGQGELDMDEQERLYSSFFGALTTVRGESDALRGTYFWRWEIEPGSGGARDRGYSPQGKTAEAVLQRMYR
ncbi:MAG: hypothetical protein MK291_04925 [Planctomycetes bacterium]|nr:hypothetical protein [Planctomycetota bacterium]